MQAELFKTLTHYYLNLCLLIFASYGLKSLYSDGKNKTNKILDKIVAKRRMDENEVSLCLQATPSHQELALNIIV